MLPKISYTLFELCRQSTCAFAVLQQLTSSMDLKTHKMHSLLSRISLLV